MSALSVRDLATLDQITASRCESADCPCMEWKQQLADLVAAHAPDVPYDRLALILLKTSGFVSLVAETNDLNGLHVGGLIIGAAANLAKEGTPS